MAISSVVPMGDNVSSGPLGCRPYRFYGCEQWQMVLGADGNKIRALKAVIIVGQTVGFALGEFCHVFPL